MGLAVRGGMKGQDMNDCMTKGPKGYLCTRTRGHDGVHRAYGDGPIKAGQGPLDEWEVATGTCPVCDGTTRRPVPEDTRRYIRYNARWGHWGIAGYQPAGAGPFADDQGYEGGTLPCCNCGGQTMSMTATGQVLLRPDGTPCEHKYGDGPNSNHRYGKHDHVCIHCGHRYFIDSGD
jgi:hypothetical protein